jgi:hypothetical protein
MQEIGAMIPLAYTLLVLWFCLWTVIWWVVYLYTKLFDCQSEMRKEMKTNYIGQEFWLRPERGAFMRKATYMIAYHIGTWLGFHPPLRNTIFIWS